MMLDCSALPRWLLALLTEKFFNACIIHEDAKKNEKNIFCFDCCEALCPHCLPSHRSSHCLLQIRRYMYHDVIRLHDAEKLMDCAFVQPYTTNSAKVLLLNQRPLTRHCRASGNVCITCHRGLQDPFLFCSLSCKIQRILRDGDKLSKYIYDCEELTLPEPGLDDGQMTVGSILEPAGSRNTESGPTSNGGMDCRTLACTADTEIVRKKRSSFGPVQCGPVSDISEAMMNRRKGTPHRSPLY